MHELAHIVLNHVGKNKRNEEEADTFASNILAPRPIIQLENLKTADEIHDFFGISYAASNNALADFKNYKPDAASNELMCYYAGIKSGIDETIRKEIDKRARTIEHNNPYLTLVKVEYVY